VLGRLLLPFLGPDEGGSNTQVQLRDRLGELLKDRPILVHCAVGLRAHVAVRILRQHGFDARNLSGGWTTWRHVAAAAESARAYLPESRTVPPEPTG
jgi:rhodanese-related sulfurtransferase